MNNLACSFFACDDEEDPQNPEVNKYSIYSISTLKLKWVNNLEFQCQLKKFECFG